MRTTGDTSAFQITVGLHRGSIKFLLVVLIVDGLTRHVQDEVLWCVLFLEDIILIDETKKGLALNYKPGGNARNKII